MKQFLRKKKCFKKASFKNSLYVKGDWVMIGQKQENSFVVGQIVTMAKKNRTVTSFAHKSFENSPSVLKFLLKLPFSIIKHH